MLSKVKQKAQSGLEYLLTYGWALVMIATIIGVLVFTVFEPQNVCNSKNPMAFICDGITRNDDIVTMRLRNMAGQKIIINPYSGIVFDDISGYAIVTYGGEEYRFRDVTIGAGDAFTVEGQGVVHTTQLNITYYETQTGLTKTASIGMTTDAPPDVELSNDGLPQTPGGPIDCQDAAVGPCEYPVEVTGPDGTPGIPPTQTIAFESTAITNLIDSGEPWDIKGAYLYVYAENVSGPGVKAIVEGVPSTDDVTEGWNVISLNFSTLLEEVNPNISLGSQGGSFSIRGTDVVGYEPQLVVVIEEGSPPPP